MMFKKRLNHACMVIGLMLVSLLFVEACQRSPVITDLSGHEVSLRAEPGKWLVVNYWASWCKPCYEEIPELNRFYEKFKKDGIAVIGVSYDLISQQKLKAVVKKMGVRYPVLTRDPAVALGIGQIAGLPATYIVNDQGKVIKQLLGPQNMRSLIQALALKEQKEGKAS